MSCLGYERGRRVMDYDDAKRDINFFYEPREGTADFFCPEPAVVSDSLPLLLLLLFIPHPSSSPVKSISHLKNRNGYDNENETQSVEYYKFIYLFIHQLNT